MWIPFFVFIGIFGLSFGDLICYHKTLLTCKFPAEVCGQVNQFTACMRRTAAQCGVSDNPDFKNSVSFLNEMCREGSALNVKYKRHLPCIRSATARYSAICNAKMLQKTQELQHQLSKSNDFMLEMMKLACEYGMDVYSCNVDKIQEKCGSGARAWYEEQSNAGGNQLNQQMCVELKESGITYSKESASSSKNHDGITYGKESASSSKNQDGITYGKESGSLSKNTDGIAHSKESGSTYENTDGIAHSKDSGSTSKNKAGITSNNLFLCLLLMVILTLRSFFS